MRERKGERPRHPTLKAERTHRNYSHKSLNGGPDKTAIHGALEPASGPRVSEPRWSLIPLAEVGKAQFAAVGSPEKEFLGNRVCIRTGSRQESRLDLGSAGCPPHRAIF